ncbi:MAG: hypothetical protein IPL01_09085 [Acidobacteria bacterium]|nr:hypothetical protein [Acidobacteriota bacterium]
MGLKGWLNTDERVISAGKAGEGNMNYTLRVETSDRSFILKQARPWVEKYPQVSAPWDRAIVEGSFTGRFQAIRLFRRGCWFFWVWMWFHES